MVVSQCSPSYKNIVIQKMNNLNSNFVIIIEEAKGVWSMKKMLASIAICGTLILGLSASARPHHGHHGGMHHIPPRPPVMHHHIMPPPIHHGSFYRHHRIGCPMYRGFGHRCTCHRYYGGSGIYIDFRLPIIF